MPSKTRVLFFDIETMAKKIYAWGDYEVNSIETAQHWYMLSFAWKWLGEKQTYVKGLPDYKGYKKDTTNDKLLVQDLWKLFDEADVIVAHNGKSFDIKKSNARFAKHGMQPPSPYKIIDTKIVAKSYFKFDSNKLDSLGDYFGIGRKINTGGFALWLGCEAGDKKSWDKMKRYNRYDVILLEKVYKHMMPFMRNHPNVALMDGNLRHCPNCGGSNLIRQGYHYTRTTATQQYQCKDCHSWHSSPSETKQIR